MPCRAMLNAISTGRSLAGATTSYRQTLLALLGCALACFVFCGPVTAYDFPFISPYAATVVGTPPAYRAEVPANTPRRERRVTVFETRLTPDFLWYSDQLRYSVALQDEKAPLIFVIAGTGGSHAGPKMRFLERVFYHAGFHVISLPSPTHPNFIVSASKTGVPGHIVEDSRDLYAVMQLVWEQVKDRIEVSAFYLTGYSLGGAQAAFVSVLDEERQAFAFSKVLIINPPVSLYNSVRILDAMLEDNIPGGLDNFHVFFEEVMERLARAYREDARVRFDGDFLYAAYRVDPPPPDEKLAALIGTAFRISSASMFFVSDVFRNAGFIAPRNRRLGRTDSVTDYFKVANRISFIDYFEKYFTPFFQARNPEITEQALIEQLSLKSIEDYLSTSEKIGLMHNEDDVIMAPGEIDYLVQVFGSRAKVYPLGGHLGNMELPENVANMLSFFGGTLEQ